MKKECLRTVLGSIAALITAIFIFLCGTVVTVATVTSEGYIVTTVKKIGYIKNSVPELEATLNTLTVPSGLPNSFFTGKINEAELQKINEKCISQNYKAASFDYDFSALKAELINYFKEYASSPESAVSSAVSEEALSSLADICIESYKTTASGKIFKYLSLYSGKLHRFAVLGAIGLLLISIIGVLFLSKLGGKFIKSNYIYFALCAGGIMSAAIPAFILITGAVRKLGITPKPVLDFITGFANGALYMMIAYGAVLIILSVVFRFLITRRKTVLNH